MFDIRAIRAEPETFDAGWKRRGLNSAEVRHVLSLDEAVRDVKTTLQNMQAKRNAESQKIGEIKKAKGDATEQMALVTEMKDRMALLEAKEKDLANDLSAILMSLPNIIAADVPDGKDETANKEIRKWGEIKKPKGADHADIGEKLGMMDFETAAKMSGARFTLLSGGLARLERALAQFFLDTHTSKEHGFTEVSPPLLVRDNALLGTGQLPKFANDHFETKAYFQGDYSDVRHGAFEDFSGDEVEAAIKKGKANNDWGLDKDKLPYLVRQRVEEGDWKIILKYDENEKLKFKCIRVRPPTRHWLIPTAEVSLTNIVADMIVEEETLPRRYTAFTPCFRSEAGSAGRDTRGMLRQHQFYKVEMVSVTAPEKSEEEHQHMLECAETVLKKLELPFRTMLLCAGDTGFGARKTYDIEVWLPGQETYREISSVSSCGDFQARRMNARTRAKGEKDTRFVHTLNGSGVAVGRALIAVIENYHDPADGGVFVPDVLKPYMGGITKITR